MKAVDANDILRKHGQDALRKAWDNAENPFADDLVNGSTVNRCNPPPTNGWRAHEQANDALEPPLNGHDSSLSLGEWDAGEDDEPIPPRGWLLGNVFCRRFASSLIGDGGVGKTALRYAQLLSLANGRSLTGEHVFQRCRVLIVSLEDDVTELRRRIRAVRMHHGIIAADLKGWLFLAAPGAAGGKLMKLDRAGRPVAADLAAKLEKTIGDRRIDIVSLDPFVKTHSIEENSNSAIDDVVQILTDLGVKHDIAIDAPPIYPRAWLTRATPIVDAVPAR